MKAKLNIVTLVVFSIIGTTQYVGAQDSGLDSLKGTHTGAYKPTIADAIKISETPEIVDSTKKIQVPEYNIKSTKIKTNFTPEPIVPAQIAGDPLEKLYNSLVKLGIGTYNTPYGELWVNKLRSKNSAGGVRLKHLSSTFTQKGYGYAGFNDDEISVYGKKFLRKHSLIGSADYFRNTVHLYGYNTDLFSLKRSDTEQRFNYIAAKAKLQSHYKDKKLINHLAGINYYTFTDRWNGVENNVNVYGFAKKNIADGVARIDANVNYTNYRNLLDTVNNTIISIRPNWTITDSSYTAKLGFDITHDVFNTTTAYLYPNVYFSYKVIDDIIVPYAGFSGGLYKNSFRSLTDINPFVNSALAMNNTSENYVAYGGIKGNLSRTTSFNAKVSTNSINDMALFVNDTTGFNNRFDVIYDDAKVFTFHGEAGYQLREKIRVNLAAIYYSYSMETELRAWHKPQVHITLSGNYNLQNKIIAKLAVYYVGAQFAKEYETDSNNPALLTTIENELDGYIDINISGEYRYTKKLGFFLNLNNLTNSAYKKFNNYPTQQFSVMGGLSYSF